MNKIPPTTGTAVFEIADAIGASSHISVQQLSVFIPNKDQNSELIDHETWIDQGLQTLAKIGGGATALQGALGFWYHKTTGKPIRETTTIVFTYIEDAKFMQHFQELRSFLHTFGAKANQDSVMFVFGNAAYFIEQYDQT